MHKIKLAAQIWADGFGLWHACLFSSGDDRRDAMIARVAIQEALTEREGPNYDPRTVRVVYEGIARDGTRLYREK